MKGGKKMSDNKTNWWIIIAIIIVVAVLASLVTVKMTGNAILTDKKLTCATGQQLGDMNGDGKPMMVSDRVTLNNIVSGYWQVFGDTCCFDLNRDQKISLADLVKFDAVMSGQQQLVGSCPNPVVTFETLERNCAMQLGESGKSCTQKCNKNNKRCLAGIFATANTTIGLTDVLLTGCMDIPQSGAPAKRIMCLCCNS